VFTHNDGVIDDKYASKVPGTAARIGQRVIVTDAFSRQAIADVEALTAAIEALATS